MRNVAAVGLNNQFSERNRGRDRLHERIDLARGIFVVERRP